VAPRAHRRRLLRRRTSRPRAAEKWAAITFCLPLIGFFIYLFERSELSYDPESDPYRDHNFNVHPSRADDTPLPSRGDDRLSPENGEEQRDE